MIDEKFEEIKSKINVALGEKAGERLIQMANSLDFMIAHWRLTDEQNTVLKQYVSGKEVHDLGAGNMQLSHHLINLGAKKVIAVDKIDIFKSCEPGYNIEIVHQDFDSYWLENKKRKIDVAVVSWPINELIVGLVRLMMQAKTVIYIGKNTDGTACGHPQMWAFLGTRDSLAYVPERSNTLIVYSDSFFGGRALHGEELAGMHRSAPGFGPQRQPVSYCAAEGLDHVDPVAGIGVEIVLLDLMKKPLTWENG